MCWVGQEGSFVEYCHGVVSISASQTQAFSRPLPHLPAHIVEVKHCLPCLLLFLLLLLSSIAVPHPAQMAPILIWKLQLGECEQYNIAEEYTVSAEQSGTQGRMPPKQYAGMGDL